MNPFADLEEADKRLLTHVASVAFFYLLFNLLVFPYVYLWAGLSQLKRLCTFWECVYFSVVTCTTLGYGEIHPDTTALQITAVIQVLASFFVIIFWLGCIFARYGTRSSSTS